MTELCSHQSPQCNFRPCSSPQKEALCSSAVPPHFPPILQLLHYFASLLRIVFNLSIFCTSGCVTGNCPQCLFHHHGALLPLGDAHCTLRVAVPTLPREQRDLWELEFKGLAHWHLVCPSWPGRNVSSPFFLCLETPGIWAHHRQCPRQWSPRKAADRQDCWNHLQLLSGPPDRWRSSVTNN